MDNDTIQFTEVRKADGMDARTGHYDALLTDMSWACQQEMDGFVCGRAFNHVTTSDRSAVYASYPPEYQLRHGFKERGEFTESQEVKWKALFDKTFLCKVYSARTVVGKQARANMSRPLDPDRDAVEILTEHSLIFKDEVWVDTFFKAGVWGVDLTGIAYSAGPPSGTQFIQWSDYVYSDPIEDIDNQKDLFRQRTGKEANKLIIGRFVYSKLKKHPKVLARIINNFSVDRGRPAKANLETLAALFEVDEVIVAQGIHDTGNEGQAVAPTFIAGKHALLCHSPARTNLKAPMAGGYFAWTGYEAGVNNLGVVVDKWYNRERKCHIMEMELAFDMRVVAASLGVFFGSAVA